jgi:hypothetical protein
MAQHEIIVGNIGSVYFTQNKKEAQRAFNTYVSNSKCGYGRAAGEPVTWFIDSEIYKEYEGSQQEP